MGQILTLLGNLHQAPKPAPASSHISREDHLAVLNHGNALFSFLPTAFWKFYILPLQTLKDGCHLCPGVLSSEFSVIRDTQAMIS